MPKGKQANGKNKPESIEATLWQSADKLRKNMDAAEYKHVVLGLIFLKYISDAFEEKHAQLVAQRTKGADPEDLDGIKPRSRLIEDQDLRVVNERLGESDPLPVPLGKFAQEMLPYGFELAGAFDPFEPFGEPGSLERTRPADKSQIFINPHIRIKRHRLR